MNQPQLPQQRVTRRTALVSAAGLGIGVPVLTACGGGGGADEAGSGYGAPTAAASSGTADVASDGAEPTAATDGGRELARLEDVPVGGAVAAQDAAGEPVIVARPRADEVVAFSAICTHRGCTVAADDGVLRCPCHGSTFDPATGENTGGPAPRPLPGVRVSVVDGAVLEG